MSKIDVPLLVNSVSPSDLINVLQENSSFLSSYLGYTSELKFKQQMLLYPGVETVEKIPDRSPQRGDFIVRYQGRDVSIELKNILTSRTKEDTLNGGHQICVSLKSSDKQPIIELSNTDRPERCYLKKGNFDVLAVCLFSIKGTWEYMFICNKHLPEVEFLPGYLKTKISFNTLNSPYLYRDFSKATLHLS